MDAADHLDVPRDAALSDTSALPLAPVPLPAALVLDGDDPVAQADLGDRPVELAR